jgi:predicted kinase
MTKHAYILRGIPGSGKTTYARSRWYDESLGAWKPGVVYCSADDFFTGPDGVYRWSAERRQEGHAYCLRRFAEAVFRGEPTVIVDNTNIRLWEVSKYHDLAFAFGYEVRVVEFLAPPELALARNVHNVRPEDHERMTRTMERPLPFWHYEVVRTG